MFLIAILIREKQKQRDNHKMIVANTKFFSCYAHEATLIGGESHGG